MEREFKFRGKNLEELRQLSDKDFGLLVNSRARRSLERGINNEINKKIDKYAGNKKKLLKVHSRAIVITPKMVGLTIAVHNGKEFIPVKIMPEMLGHVLGEYALTRKKLKHGKAGIGATKSSTAITARG